MTDSRHIRNIALCGFMGTGKSSVGRLLAQTLHFDFLDTDTVIEARAGKTIPEIFAEQGEAAFRELEHKIALELTHRRRTVIATGGGFVVNPANMAALKEHALVVCLWACPETIWARVKTQTHRPLLHDPDPLNKISTLLAQRAPSYKQANVLVNTELRSTRDVAQQILHHFRIAVAAPTPH